jgi:hypothetical protein
MRAIIEESKSTSILQLASLNINKVFGKVSIKEYFAKNKKKNRVQNLFKAIKIIPPQ